MDKTEISQLIKFLGIQTETQLNQIIQKRLSDKNLLSLANLAIQNHNQDLKLLRDYQELLALQLNIPTKDDVANVAKIAIQIEEKLDILENQIFHLSEEIQSLNQRNKDPYHLYEIDKSKKWRKNSG